MQQIPNNVYDACPIRQVISRFGDKWSMLVLSTLDQSSSGVLRYSEIQRQITDCSQKMLSQTLRRLESNHLVSRTVYPVVPPKVEYALTERGRSLIPILHSMCDWGERHRGDMDLR